MNILELLNEKRVKYMTDAKIEVELVIKSVEKLNHSEDLGPSTRENDWWPPTRDWTTYKVTFTNGFIKEFNNIEDIKII